MLDLLFNSWEYLVFFPIVVLIYFAIPKKIKHIWLLIASCYFYMCWNPKYILLIGFSIVAIYISGILLNGIVINEKSGAISPKKASHRKKGIVACCFVVNLMILALFKYWNFILGNVNFALSLLHAPALKNRFSFVLPVGISFYTFQALSYTMDVYRGDIEAERDFFKYALFVSFFPQLVAGPIERSKNLLKDIQNIPNKKLLDYDRITSGMTIMLYGMFLKLVIADRVAIVVNAVFDHYRDYNALTLWIAAVGFAFQIYCDFASYSTIAIGSAKVMGFTLMENFDTPYFARSIKEFWRRWHISLSTWFRDYLYFPLGGSRCSKLRKYMNLMVVFLVSGLWHGAGWHFIAWGFVHGLYQIVGDVTAPVRQRVIDLLHVKKESTPHKLFQTMLTFFMVTLAWVLFRADNLKDAGRYLYRMLTGLRPHQFFTTNLVRGRFDQLEWAILVLSLLVLLAFSLVKYNQNKRVDQFLAGCPLWFRWLVLYGLLFSILIFGKYGPDYSQQAFIYFQF